MAQQAELIKLAAFQDELAKIALAPLIPAIVGGLAKAAPTLSTIGGVASVAGPLLGGLGKPKVPKIPTPLGRIH
jgi:hypothetical protein